MTDLGGDFREFVFSEGQLFEAGQVSDLWGEANKLIVGHTKRAQ